MEKIRKMFVGIVPVSDDFKLDTNNELQVKNYTALCESSLKDTLFAVMDESFKDVNDGGAEISSNLEALSFDETTDKFKNWLDAVSKIVYEGDMDYDNGELVVDVAKGFVNMVEDSVEDGLSTLRNNPNSMISLTKLLILAQTIAVDFTSDVNSELFNSEVPIFLIAGTYNSLLEEINEDIEDAGFYLGFAIYSAILLAMMCQFKQKDAPELPIIALSSLAIAPAILTHVPKDQEIHTEIMGVLMREYISRKHPKIEQIEENEIPDGYILN